MQSDTKYKAIMTVLITIIMLSISYIGYANVSINASTASYTPYIGQSAECIAPTAGSATPFKLPPNWKATIVAEEDIAQAYMEDLPDMNQQNLIEIDMPNVLQSLGVTDTKAKVGRLLYQTHETSSGGSVSVVDLETGIVGKLAEADHFENLDGLKWTPWNTLLFAEEIDVQNYRDPEVPDTIAGLLYELDPVSGEYWPRPQVGALAHEGIAIDKMMNIYVIDEDKRGAIYKFVPDVDPRSVGHVPNGTLYALRIIDDTAAPGERTGTAEWVMLNQTLARIDAEEAAKEVNATVYNRPEDLEIIGNKLYVALTGKSAPGPVDNRILAIDISNSSSPFVTEFVVPGVNVPEEIDDIGDESDEQTGFNAPDNLAAKWNTLWIVEDNSPSDIWVAKPDRDGDGYADKVILFASIEDCEAELTGLLWGIGDYKDKLFVTQMHSGPVYNGEPIGSDRIFIIEKVYKP